MDSILVYDAEFLTSPGAPQRFWCGPSDPDPLVIQIGVVRLRLVPPFDLSEPQDWLIRPVDRDGRVVPLDPLVTRLTGITDAMLEAQGLGLGEALSRLDAFRAGDPMYAWGKDELTSLAPSLFVQGIQSPIPAQAFRSAVPLLVRAGLPPDTVITLRSHTLCAHFGLPEAGPAHDAKGDALSVAHVLRHLLQRGDLVAGDFARP